MGATRPRTDSRSWSRSQAIEARVVLGSSRRTAARTASTAPAGAAVRSVSQSPSENSRATV